MIIYAFANYYPSTYKPYYDMHFSSLLEMGHDLKILATKPLDTVEYPKLLHPRLLDVVDYFPADELRGVPSSLAKSIRAIIDSGWRKTALAVAKSESTRKGALKSFARALSLPRTPPDICIIHGHGTLFLVPWLKTLYPSASIALYYHGGVSPEQTQPILPGQARESVDLIFTNSEFSRRMLENAEGQDKPTIVLPVSFEMELFSPPAQRNYRAEGVLDLLSVGRLSSEKGLVFALEALRKISVSNQSFNFRYSIIGGGPEEAALKEDTKRMGLADRVTFTGPLPYREVIRRIGQSDILLLPSISTAGSSETQGAVLQEAMLMKTLLVATRTGGIPEHVPPFLQRFLVQERDPEDLRQVILEIARLPMDRCGELGERASRWTRERYNVQQFNESLIRHSLAGPSPKGT